MGVGVNNHVVSMDLKLTNGNNETCFTEASVASTTVSIASTLLQNGAIQEKLSF